MAHRLRMMPPSERTRKKISKTLTGHEVTQETKDKISAALKGRKRPAEAVENAAKARRAMPPRTNENLIKACKAEARARSKKNNGLRREQHKADLIAAWQIDRELWRDVKKSYGWRSKRRKFDTSGKVSNGFYYPSYKRACMGKISWESRNSTSNSSGDLGTTSSPSSPGPK